MTIIPQHSIFRLVINYDKKPYWSIRLDEKHSAVSSAQKVWEPFCIRKKAVTKIDNKGFFSYDLWMFCNTRKGSGTIGAVYTWPWSNSNVWKPTRWILRDRARRRRVCCTCIVANVTFESSSVCVLSPTIITRPLSSYRPIDRRGETSSRVAGVIKKKIKERKNCRSKLLVGSEQKPLTHLYYLVKLFLFIFNDQCLGEANTKYEIELWRF